MGSQGINDRKKRARAYVLMEGELAYFSGEICCFKSGEY